MAKSDNDRLDQTAQDNLRHDGDKNEHALNTSPAQAQMPGASAGAGDTESTSHADSTSQPPVSNSNSGNAANNPYAAAVNQATSAPSPNVDDQRRLRSAQSQITFAFVAAPLSLFFGGMLLGAISFIVALLAFRKLSVLERKERSVAEIATKMKRSAKIAMVFALVAFGLNCVSLYLMYPVLMEMLQNGQYGDVAGSMSAGTAAGTSTWG